MPIRNPMGAAMSGQCTHWKPSAGQCSWSVTSGSLQCAAVFHPPSSDLIEKEKPFQGATSTILGIMVLILVDSYIVLIFFKTVFLVISFSMLHGLLFLPILLILIIPETRVSE